MTNSAPKQQTLQIRRFRETAGEEGPVAQGSPVAAPGKVEPVRFPAHTPDLRQEAANMLALASLQAELETPLSLSSKSVQVVLKQF